eukprot:TRINITY_DN59073_c0_g1_i1.p1 TRINITY_DN59073_c0_g1~~TRINITY_DN59073_c0_g1_i1.p1  ORF type:complete len:231 (-),score=17.27 TRINITY_DN59073_c0_g1_i1:105-722(-)
MDAGRRRKLKKASFGGSSTEVFVSPSSSEQEFPAWSSSVDSSPCQSESVTWRQHGQSLSIHDTWSPRDSRGLAAPLDRSPDVGLEHEHNTSARRLDDGRHTFVQDHATETLGELSLSFGWHFQSFRSPHTLRDMAAPAQPHARLRGFDRDISLRSRAYEARLGPDPEIVEVPKVVAFRDACLSSQPSHDAIRGACHTINQQLRRF